MGGGGGGGGRGTAYIYGSTGKTDGDRAAIKRKLSERGRVGRSKGTRGRVLFACVATKSPKKSKIIKFSEGRAKGGDKSRYLPIAAKEDD